MLGNKINEVHVGYTWTELDVVKSCKNIMSIVKNCKNIMSM